MKSFKEDGRPAIQFYVDDWLSEPGLNICSLAAQGLWIKMLCYMFKADFRGCLQANGKRITSKQLAKLAGESEEVIKGLLSELKEKEVYSTRPDGTIYNRRMYNQTIREREISKVRQEAGRKGGKAKGKQKDKKEVSKEEAKTPATSSSSSSSSTSKDINTLSGKKPDLAFPILYLNEKANRNFDPQKECNKQFVKARYKEGRTVEDFKWVIDKKVSDWLTDKEMMKYLRPSTLFNRTKFENYINEPEDKRELDPELYG